MDPIDKLPIDNSPVPKSHLEMLDMLMHDKTKMNSIMSKLKAPLFGTVLFLLFTSDFGSTLLKKMTGTTHSYIYIAIIYFIVFVLFELKSK